MGRGFSIVLAACALACLMGSASCSQYFPEGVKLPKVDLSRYVDTPDLQDYDMPMPGLNEHPARFLPVNHTRARFYACPWAFAAPPGRLTACLKGRLWLQQRRESSCHKPNTPTPNHKQTPLMMTNEHLNAATNKAPNTASTGRRGFLLLAGLAALGAGAGRAEATGPTLRDMMEEADAKKAAKDALEASKPKRPTELRDKPVCFKWNGEEKCFKCTTECEYYKTLNPDLDCNKWCTVEYGQPKPTDEESVSFMEFVQSVSKKEITSVDFYGPNGDRAYATYTDGHKIRIGEGFPVEIGNEAQSPMFVVRLLQGKDVPFKFHFLDNIKYKKMGGN